MLGGKVLSLAVLSTLVVASPALSQEAPAEGAPPGEAAPGESVGDTAPAAEPDEGAKPPEDKPADEAAKLDEDAKETVKEPAKDGAGGVLPPPGQLPFIDLDGDQSPAPIVHSFRGDLFNAKIGTGMAGAMTSPFGARTGFGHVFTEGDYLFGDWGIGVHWDAELRMGLGLLEQRGRLNVFGPDEFIAPDNSTATNPIELMLNKLQGNTNVAFCQPFDPAIHTEAATSANPPVVGTDFVTVPAGAERYQAVDIDCEISYSFYRRQTSYPTGRTNDYFRMDRLWFSYDKAFFGVDVGRVQVLQASNTIVDGAQVRFDFDLFKVGLFAGFRPNPWHQQVVGASSGGWVPQPFQPGLPLTLNEYFQVRWGDVFSEDAYRAPGNTSGAYGNELGPSLFGANAPWLQLGSVRFPAGGVWSSLRFDPVFMDIALGMDLFGDPSWAVCGRQELPDPNDPTQIIVQGVGQNGQACEPGVLYRPDQPTSPLGATPPGIDRVYVTTTGGWRIFQPLTLAWRGTLDIIGARPMWLRDLFLDLTWRNLGPVTLSATYFRINTYATAYSYWRFFRPLENVDLNAAGGGLPIPGEGINNANLFLVDRDRVALSASMFLWGTLQGYVDLIGERRNDFMYTEPNLPAQLQGFAGSFSQLGQPGVIQQQFLCNQPAARSAADGPVVTPPGGLVGTNPAFPVYTDRCKIGITAGLRDAFLGNVGTFDVHGTHMQGYYSANSRVSGRLGVAVLDVLWLGMSGGAERNFVHRVYAPACDKDGACPPGYSPASRAESQQSSWSYVPQALNAFTLGADASWRILGGWYVEGSYFGWLEEIPYQGDYYDTAGIASPRDPFQFTHTVYFRTLYRFF